MRGINDGKVSREEFEDYYSYISACFDNDQYFELLINNSWRINEGAELKSNEKPWTKGHNIFG